jgi:hypothetical protein
MHPSLCPSVAVLQSPPSLLGSLPYSCPMPTMPHAQDLLNYTRLIRQQQHNHSLLSALFMTQRQAFPPGSAWPTPFVNTPPLEASIPNAQVKAPRGRPVAKARSLAGRSKVEPLRSERLEEKPIRSPRHLHLPITLATAGDEFKCRSTKHGCERKLKSIKPLLFDVTQSLCTAHVSLRRRCPLRLH